MMNPMVLFSAQDSTLVPDPSVQPPMEMSTGMSLRHLCFFHQNPFLPQFFIYLVLLTPEIAPLFLYL